MNFKYLVLKSWISKSWIFNMWEAKSWIFYIWQAKSWISKSWILNIWQATSWILNISRPNLGFSIFGRPSLEFSNREFWIFGRLNLEFLNRKFSIFGWPNFKFESFKYLACVSKSCPESFGGYLSRIDGKRYFCPYLWIYFWFGFNRTGGILIRMQIIIALGTLWYMTGCMLTYTRTWLRCGYFIK